MVVMMLRVPVGGDARLECSITNLGDFMQVWKNGTRVISVGSLKVTKFAVNSQNFKTYLLTSLITV